MGTMLNADIRNEIIRNAMKAQFDPKWVTMDECERALSHRAYVAAVPLKIREHAAAIMASPSRGVWFKDPNPGNLVSVIGLMGRHYRMWAHEDIPVPVTGSWGPTVNIADERHRKLQDLIQDHMDAKQALKDAKEKACTALTSTLGRIRTFEKLCEQWPEGKKFYQSPPLAKPIALPVIRFSEINQLLGL